MCYRKCAHLPGKCTYFYSSNICTQKMCFFKNTRGHFLKLFEKTLYPSSPICPILIQAYSISLGYLIVETNIV